jgi:hypothetical protein
MVVQRKLEEQSRTTLLRCLDANRDGWVDANEAAAYLDGAVRQRDDGVVDSTEVAVVRSEVRRAGVDSNTADAIVRLGKGEADARPIAVPQSYTEKSEGNQIPDWIDVGNMEITSFGYTCMCGSYFAELTDPNGNQLMLFNDEHAEESRKPRPKNTLSFVLAGESQGKEMAVPLGTAQQLAEGLQSAIIRGGGYVADASPRKEFYLEKLTDALDRVDAVAASEIELVPEPINFHQLIGLGYGGKKDQFIMSLSAGDGEINIAYGTAEVPGELFPFDETPIIGSACMVEYLYPQGDHMISTGYHPMSQNELTLLREGTEVAAYVNSAATNLGFAKHYLRFLNETASKQ